jgi:hypothetical protein
MKKLLFTILLISGICYSQKRWNFNQYEEATATIAVDPGASYKEKGLDIVGEIEYSGTVYAKAGFESFSALQGGYWDIHGSFGINFLHNENSPFRIYTGIRLARVARAGSFKPIFGQEIGVDYNLSENCFIGTRFTKDKRYDQEILGWDAQTVNSVFVRIGYKWNLKK